MQSRYGGGETDRLWKSRLPSTVLDDGARRPSLTLPHLLLPGSHNPSNIAQRSSPTSLTRCIPVVLAGLWHSLPRSHGGNRPVCEGTAQTGIRRAVLCARAGRGCMSEATVPERPPATSASVSDPSCRGHSVRKGEREDAARAEQLGHTTNTSPSPFSIVHLTLYPSRSNPSCSFLALPSMKASLTKALMGEAGVTVSAAKAGVNDLDHKIRPPETASAGRR